MLVREIMTSPAFSVRLQDDLDAALTVMAEHRVTALPVVNDDNDVVGVLSEMDLMRRVVAPDLRAHVAPAKQADPPPAEISEVMTRDPRTSRENDDVNDLVKLFLDTRFKSLPVVRGKKLVGVISRSDVIRALWRPDNELLADLRSAFDDQGMTGWELSVTKGVAEVRGPDGPKQPAIAEAVARSVLGIRRVTVNLV